MLGLGFLNRTRLFVHVDARKFAFRFARIVVRHFPSIEWSPAVKIFTQHFIKETLRMTTLSDDYLAAIELDRFITKNPVQFYQL
jgi:hypothetical protein